MTNHDLTETEVSADHAIEAMALFVNSDLFANLGMRYIREITRHAELEQVSANQVIINDDEINDAFYIIKSGICELVELDSTEGERVIMTLTAGEAFGEESLISTFAIHHQVRMQSAGELYRISKYDFEHLIKQPTLQQVTLQGMLEAVRSGASIIDVRPEEDYREAHIKGSLHIESGQLLQQIAELDQDANYIIYCDNAIKSSICAFKLMQRGIQAAYLDEGVGKYIDNREILPLVIGTDQENSDNLLKELQNTRDALQAAHEKNATLIVQYNQLREKYKDLQEHLKKSINAQKMILDERNRIKLHLAGVRQSIRDNLRGMIDAMNAHIKTRRGVASAESGKDNLIRELLSLGELVVLHAKRINSRTQHITSSSKILSQIVQPGKQPPAPETDTGKSDTDTGEKVTNRSNVVELEVKKDIRSNAWKGKPAAGNPSSEEDFMQRYEETTWKAQDINRLKQELDETHTDLLSSDVEEYLRDKP